MSTGRWCFIDGVTAELEIQYRILLECPKREVLGKEYFCLEVEVLRVCWEVSSSAIPIKSLLKCNQLIKTYQSALECTQPADEFPMFCAPALPQSPSAVPKAMFSTSGGAGLFQAAPAHASFAAELVRSKCDSASICLILKASAVPFRH